MNKNTNTSVGILLWTLFFFITMKFTMTAATAVVVAKGVTIGVRAISLVILVISKSLLLTIGIYNGTLVKKTTPKWLSKFFELVNA